MARCRGWWVWMVVVLWLDAGSVTAQEVLHVYGPGGPAPAMREAAAEFGRTTGIQVEVTAGPTAKWLAKAKSDADIVYSGAEFMMTDLIAAMEGAVDEATVMPLYLRPAAILVRPGNPKRIQDFPDLLKPGMKVLVVQGAGQTGLWEDMAGKQGDIRTVRALRRNIRAVMPNSADAKARWEGDPPPPPPASMRGSPGIRGNWPIRRWPISSPFPTGMLSIEIAGLPGPGQARPSPSRPGS
jgi:accessory colonization factor AcfC